MLELNFIIKIISVSNFIAYFLFKSDFLFIILTDIFRFKIEIEIENDVKHGPRPCASGFRWLFVK